jgi:uroporphyrinogen III methyltransferase/synthase
LFLHEHGIRFEVVPGVPAGIGVPSYAGIPLTYPGGADTLTFVRGYEDEQHTLPKVDWTSLANLRGTLVCYASARQLPNILRALLTHGCPPDISAAVTVDGTLPSQHTRAGTVGELARATDLADDRRPAILVVGAVAGFRDHLRWFDARPLFGRRIVVTRAREQAGELVEMLEELGAEVILTSSIRILPAEDQEAVDRACAQAGTFDWIVFASANAVDHFMRRLLAGPRDVRELKGVKLCAVGPSTAERVAAYGLKVDVVPPEYQSEAVADAIRARGDLAGARILLPRAEEGREVLADQLRASGADVVEVVTYRTVANAREPAGDRDVYRMLLDRQIDAVTFTSPSTVRAFVQLIGEEPAADLLRTTAVASIGPVTAEAAGRLNISTTVMPSSYTVRDMVRSLVDYFAMRGS